MIFIIKHKLKLSVSRHCLCLLFVFCLLFFLLSIYLFINMNCFYIVGILIGCLPGTADIFFTYFSYLLDFFKAGFSFICRLFPQGVTLSPAPVGASAATHFPKGSHLYLQPWLVLTFGFLKCYRSTNDGNISRTRCLRNNNNKNNKTN